MVLLFSFRVLSLLLVQLSDWRLLRDGRSSNRLRFLLQVGRLMLLMLVLVLLRRVLDGLSGLLR